MSRWDITESHQNYKKTVMFFITMKKVKRKTIKTCHSPDDEKNIKVAIPMLTKKISIQNNFFSQN